jgi:hypothetical protein
MEEIFRTVAILILIAEFSILMWIGSLVIYVISYNIGEK